MIELLPDIFALPVPDDASRFEVYMSYLQRRVGFWIKENNADEYSSIGLPSGSWSILFTSKDAGEEEFGKIVSKSESWGSRGLLYENYNLESDRIAFLLTARKSFLSLLTSKGLDPKNNYVILKKEK